MKKFTGYEKGINLGGWISQGINDPVHLRTFITESDIEKIASWGLDHLRLPVDYDIIQAEDESPLEIGYECIDNCIKWCRKYKLNMILDLHKTAGYNFDDQAASDFFESEELQQRFLRLWNELASRYSKDTDIVTFELLNEVVNPNVADKWNEVTAECINVIRKITKDARIIVGGVEYNAVTSIKSLSVPADENIIYTFHCYEPLIFTHQAAYWIDTMPEDLKMSYPDSLDHYKKVSVEILGDRAGFLMNDKFGFTSVGTDFFEKLFKEAIETAEERNVALYCGEYGVIDRANPEDAVNWYKDINSVFNKYGIGHAAWTYKSKDFGLTDNAYDTVRDQIIALL